MRVFIDNCLAPRVAKALAQLEDRFEVEHLKQIFPSATDDVEWIRVLARDRDWIVVTADLMYRVRQEREAIQQAGHVVFFLSKGWANLPLWEQASKLFHWWPRLMDEALKAKRGDCFLVPVKGGKLSRPPA